MDWVAEHFAPGAVAFSLMSQYLPWGRAAEFPALNRRLRPSEVRSAERPDSFQAVPDYAGSFL